MDNAFQAAVLFALALLVKDNCRASNRALWVICFAVVAGVALLSLAILPPWVTFFFGG